MKKTGIITASIIVVLLAALFFSGKSAYNRMVTLDQTVEQTWAQVEVQYQRRLDLIPNIVETVKGYAAHESTTFQNVTDARAGLSKAYNDARDLQDATTADAVKFDAYNTAQQSLNRALNLYVNAVHEAYPDLKADTQFANLQTVLEGTENRIATERGRYTQAVKDYNLAVKRFPANLWADIFGFETKPQFTAETEAAKAPHVQF